MKIATVGAIGGFGAFIRHKALARGHHVTTFVHHPQKIGKCNPRLTIVKADILKGDLAELVKGHDALISAYNPGSYNQQVEGYKAIISGVKESGTRRLLVVAGAGSLEVSPAVQLIDVKDFAEQVNKGLLAIMEVLSLLREEGQLEWTFLSPPPSVSPLERTRRYRKGKDQVLKNEDGESKISTQDCAVAMAYELENPQHIRERFTLAC